MTQKSCAVGMRNAKLGNCLNAKMTYRLEVIFFKRFYAIRGFSVILSLEIFVYYYSKKFISVIFQRNINLYMSRDEFLVKKNDL